MNIKLGKKSLMTGLVMLMGLITAFSACARDEVRVKYAEMPVAVKQTVGKHFAGAKVSKVIMDKGDRVPEYDIYLQNGTKIEVKQTGEFKEAENRSLGVPVSLLPAQARNYLVANYPNQKVVKIDKDYKGYEVKFADGMEIDFGPEGNFLKIDR